METTKQTYKKIKIFVGVASILLSKEIDGNRLSKEHKLAYALGRVLPKCNEAVLEYNEKVEDLENFLASMDKDGNVLRDEFGLKFTKENQKKRIEQIRELFKTGETEVPQYIAAEVPEWLPEDVKEAFEGFVIKSNNEPKSV